MRSSFAIPSSRSGQIAVPAPIAKPYSNIMLKFTRVVLRTTQVDFLIPSQISQKIILPSSKDVIEINLPNDLSPDTYWAQITVFLENGWTIGKRMIKFKIVEPGKPLLKEEKPIISKEEEPITLGVSWAIIMVWVFILAFVVWTIAKNKHDEK